MLEKSIKQLNRVSITVSLGLELGLVLGLVLGLMPLLERRESYHLFGHLVIVEFTVIIVSV